MLKVAQIGVGYWGPNLLRNLVSNTQVIVEKVCELDESRREYVVSMYPAITVVDNAKSIIEDPSIDAVIIATPVHTHFELAKQCLENGKHILVEKPMAHTLEEVTELGVIAEKNKCVAMSGHTFLFNDAVRYVKDYIKSGELGEVRYIYSQRLNLGRIRHDVDALWNLAPHDISIIQYWLDDLEPSSYLSAGMDYIQKNIEDVVFVNLTYPNKVLANIHVSWLDPHKTRKMTIVGSKKMIVYDDMAEYKIAIYDKNIVPKAVVGENMDYDNVNMVPQFQNHQGSLSYPKISYKEPLKQEINHFIDCIQNNTPCISGIEHTKKVVKILSESSKQYAPA